MPQIEPTPATDKISQITNLLEQRAAALERHIEARKRFLDQEEGRAVEARVQLALAEGAHAELTEIAAMLKETR